MSLHQNQRTGRHVDTRLAVNLVFVTLTREDVLTPDMRHETFKIMNDVCEDFGATLTLWSARGQHVYLEVIYPPTVAVSRLVNSLKGVSSRYLRKHFPELASKGPLWSPSYLAVSIGNDAAKHVDRFLTQTL